MSEWMVWLVGGSGLIGSIVGALTLYSNHTGSNIDWYDRVEKDNQRLRSELDKSKKENEQLRSKVLQLRLVVNKLRMEVRELKKKLDKYIGG